MIKDSVLPASVVSHSILDLILFFFWFILSFSEVVAAAAKGAVFSRFSFFPSVIFCVFFPFKPRHLFYHLNHVSAYVCKTLG